MLRSLADLKLWCYDLAILVFLCNKESLGHFELLVFHKLYLRLYVSKESEVLLLGWFEQLRNKLGSIAGKILLVLSGFVEGLLGALDVLLHNLKEGFIGVQQKLVFLQVDIFWRNRVLAKVRTNHNAEAIAANDCLVQSFKH